MRRTPQSKLYIDEIAFRDKLLVAKRLQDRSTIERLFAQLYQHKKMPGGAFNEDFLEFLILEFPVQAPALIFSESPCPVVGERKSDSDPSVTQLAIRRNRDKDIFYDEKGVPCVFLSGMVEPAYMVTSKTRQFNKPVCIVSPSDEQEHVILDAKSEYLANLFSEQIVPLVLGKNKSIVQILAAVAQFTRGWFLMQGSKEHDSKFDSFTTPLFVASYPHKPHVALEDFVSRRVGVCRHKALLNAYFLQKLKELALLDGDIIYHHQYTTKTGGGHAWNLFRDRKSGKLYSLDSNFKYEPFCVDDIPGRIDAEYDSPGLVTEKLKANGHLPAQGLDEKKTNPKAYSTTFTATIARAHITATTSKVNSSTTDSVSFPLSSSSSSCCYSYCCSTQNRGGG